MSTRQSRKVKSGVTEAKGIAEALQWCLMWEITTCSVNWWPSGDVACWSQCDDSFGSSIIKVVPYHCRS
jgi:hypothetical protein